MESISLDFVVLVMGIHLLIAVVVSITLSITFVGEGFTKFYVVKSLVIETISFLAMVFIDKITEVGLDYWIILIVFIQMLAFCIVAVIKNSSDNAMKMVFVLITVQELFSIIVFFLYYVKNIGLDNLFKN